MGDHNFAWLFLTPLSSRVSLTVVIVFLIRTLWHLGVSAFCCSVQEWRSKDIVTCAFDSKHVQSRSRHRNAVTIMLFNERSKLQMDTDALEYSAGKLLQHKLFRFSDLCVLTVWMKSDLKCFRMFFVPRVVRLNSIPFLLGYINLYVWSNIGNVREGWNWIPFNHCILLKHK